MKLFTQLTLSVAVIFSLPHFVSAQTVNQGAWMAGGSAGFSSEKYKEEDESTTYITINPDVAYYIIDDLAVGLNVNFSSTAYDGNSTSTTFVGPYVRYYITNPIFISVGANFGLDDGAGTAFGAAVGYSWFLNNAVAIEPQVFFSSFNNDGDLNDGSEFGLSIGIQAFLGRTSGE